MAKTRLFVIRHGRTMFNTIGRSRLVRYALDSRRRTRIQGSRIGLRSLVWSLLERIPVTQAVPFRPMGIILDGLGLKRPDSLSL